MKKISNNGKTGEKLEGQKVEGAEEAANQTDKHQPSDWMTNKNAPRTED